MCIIFTCSAIWDYRRDLFLSSCQVVLCLINARFCPQFCPKDLGDFWLGYIRIMVKSWDTNIECSHNQFWKALKHETEVQR